MVGTPICFVTIMHQENKQWLLSAWLVFGNDICWYATTVLSQICPIFLATCWNLLSKYGKFKNFFPIIWRFGVSLREKRKKEKESFVLFAPPLLFCCQDAKIRQKKNILAAQCLPGFGNPYPLICLLDHCKQVMQWYIRHSHSRCCFASIVEPPHHNNHQAGGEDSLYYSNFQDCLAEVQILETKSAGRH